MSGVSDICGI